ncbi:MAG: TetR/AcrR family transcriptional regulator [Pseudomonadota bacterium]
MSQPAETPGKPYHHGDLRGHLLRVVRDLIETDGPDGFSVAEAARRAGVSSAAPYKHFRDRAEILHAIASDALERLGKAMAESAAPFPRGSIEAVAALGKAYIDFAHTEPGIFRLTFGLTEGQEQDPALMEKGRATFGIVKQEVAAVLGLPVAHLHVQRGAYLLWTVVHGHSFLGIDCKNTQEVGQIKDWDLLLAAGQAVLGREAQLAAQTDRER